LKKNNLKKDKIGKKENKPRKEWFAVISCKRKYMYGAFYKRSSAVSYKKECEAKYGEKFEIIDK